MRYYMFFRRLGSVTRWDVGQPFHQADGTSSQQTGGTADHHFSNPLDVGPPLQQNEAKRSQNRETNGQGTGTKQSDRYFLCERGRPSQGMVLKPDK
jgi:hypothetical protein